MWKFSSRAQACTLAVETHLKLIFSFNDQNCRSACGKYIKIFHLVSTVSDRRIQVIIATVFILTFHRHKPLLLASSSLNAAVSVAETERHAKTVGRV